MLGSDTVVLEGSNMKNGQLLPFWQVMHLILSYCIDPKKDMTEVSFQWAEFIYLVARGEPINLASYIFQTIRAKALSHDTVSLPYGILLT